MKSEFRTHKTMICGIEIIPADWTDLISSDVDAKSNPAQSDKSDSTNVDIYGNQLDPSHTDCNVHKHSDNLDPVMTRTIINTLKSLGFAGAKSWTGK